MSPDRAAERRLLTFAVGSQASISVASWGLGSLGQELRDTFHLSATGLGAVLAASFVGNAAILVPAGGFVDRTGPRRPLIAGGLASGLALVAGAFAPNAWLLGLCLFVFGLTGAFVAIAGTVSIFHGIDPTRRGTAMGIRQMSVSGGGLVAAALLPWLASIGGVRLSLVASGILAALFATFFGMQSPAGALSASAANKRMNIPALLRTPGLLGVLAIALVHVAALAAVLNFSVPAIRDAGYSRQVGVALFVVISVSAMLARLAWGRLADRDGGRRRKATMREVAIVTIVGALLYWAATPIGPLAQIPAIFILAFGAMGANGLLHLMGGELAGQDRAGQAVGLVSMVLFGGAALANIPLGLLADHVGFTALWPVCAALGAGSLLLTLRLPDDRPEPIALP